METNAFNTSYAAVVIFMLLFDCILVDRLRKTPGFGRAQSWILTLLAAAAVCTVSDALCVQLGARAGRVGAFLLNAVFDASAEFIAFFMFMYCEMIYDVKRILQRKVLIPLMLPMLVMLVLLMASWWTGWIFSVDAAGEYTRGPLFPVFVYGLANSYTIAAVLDFGIHLKREADPGKRRLLKECMCYFIPLVVGTICQFFFTSLPTSNIGLTVSLLLIFMDNQEKLLTSKQNEIEEKQKLLEEAMARTEAANRAKTQFLQRMSHDIRTPINGICGMLEVAEYYASDLDKQAECRAKIKEASHLLLELVNEVLDMGKLESGEITLEEIPFDLREITENVLTVIEKLASERGIQVSCDGSRIRHRKLVGSPGHVKRLMMNIMSNAVKYNKDGGEIRLTGRELASQDEDVALIEFRCRDTGIGMSPAFQKHIFEPFTQEQGGSRTKYAGSGLGMAIAKSLAETMGGTLRFESEEGKGTTFIVTIPFRIDGNEMGREPVRKMSAASIAGLHILLAEDNELNMEIAEFVLKSRDARVSKAWNGREATEIFAAADEDSFDAILMDVMMPEMDGYAATRKIRAMNRADAARIPIIAMTANAFAEDKQQSREAGMDGHLAKPLDTELLVQTVAELAAKRPEKTKKKINTRTLEVQKIRQEKRDRTNTRNGEMRK